jgi:hypothetical protein
MPKMVSKIDIVLQIPPKMRGIFPNETALNIELKAGQPIEVPGYVLKYYTATRPHVYTDASDAKETIPTPQAPPKKEVPFNPEDWLNDNYTIIEEAAPLLDRKQLMAIGKYMRLNGCHKQTSTRVVERIIQDVAMRKAQADKLDKHEGAK